MYHYRYDKEWKYCQQVNDFVLVDAPDLFTLCAKLRRVHGFSV